MSVMKLEQLVSGLDYELKNGTLDVEVTDIQNDSRKVKEGSLFFCITGAVFDGHKYAAEVAQKGAAVLVVEKDDGTSETNRCYSYKGFQYPSCDGCDQCSLLWTSIG